MSGALEKEDPRVSNEQDQQASIDVNQLMPPQLNQHISSVKSVKPSLAKQLSVGSDHRPPQRHGSCSDPNLSVSRKSEVTRTMSTQSDFGSHVCYIRNYKCVASSVCVCVFVCVCACIVLMCMCVYVHAPCVQICMCLCACASTCICTCVAHYVHVCVCVYTCVHTCVYLFVCMYVLD